MDNCFSPYRLLYCGGTDVGILKTKNDDAWGVTANHCGFCLADGIGGAKAGNFASLITISTLIECFNEWSPNFLGQTSPELLKIMIENFVEHTNSLLFRMGTAYQSFNGMGCTLCLAYFHQKFVLLCHVGDSRIYRLRDKQLTLLTQDHTLYNMLLKEEKQHSTGRLLFRRYQNVLTQAMGTKKEIKPHWSIQQTSLNDIYLICSDGLYRSLSADTIIDILCSEQLDTVSKVKQLIETAKNKGGNDNITVIVVWLESNACKNSPDHSINQPQEAYELTIKETY